MRCEKPFLYTNVAPKLLKNCNTRSVIAGKSSFGTNIQKSAKYSEEFCGSECREDTLSAKILQFNDFQLNIGWKTNYFSQTVYVRIYKNLYIFIFAVKVLKSSKK